MTHRLTRAHVASDAQAEERNLSGQEQKKAGPYSSRTSSATCSSCSPAWVSASASRCT